MTATTATLTYWVRDTFRFVTREAAESSVYGGPDALVEEVARTYSVGDRVAVRAFGRLRPGVITAVARKTVTVNFRKNANGDTDERKFTAVEVTNERDALTAVGHILPDDHSTATLAELEETVAAMDAHRAVPAAATREEVTATVTESRYEAVRRNGRPGVLDRTTGKVTQTRTRGIAEEKVAKLNRQHEAEARITAAEDAVAAVYERAAKRAPMAERAAAAIASEDAARDRAAAKDADAATVAASIQTQGDFLTEVGALLGGSSLRQRAAAARERTLIAREAAPVAPVPAPAPEAPTQPEAAAEKPAKLFSVWVGHRMADALMPLADTEPGTALGSIGGKLRDAKQGRRLARTIRLTPAEREALAGYATQVENDAVEGKDAPLADSARTLRGRLA